MNHSFCVNVSFELSYFSFLQPYICCKTLRIPSDFLAFKANRPNFYKTSYLYYLIKYAAIYLVCSIKCESFVLCKDVRATTTVGCSNSARCQFWAQLFSFPQPYKCCKTLRIPSENSYFWASKFWKKVHQETWARVETRNQSEWIAVQSDFQFE